MKKEGGENFKSCEFMMILISWSYLIKRRSLIWIILPFILCGHIKKKITKMLWVHVFLNVIVKIIINVKLTDELFQNLIVIFIGTYSVTHRRHRVVVKIIINIKYTYYRIFIQNLIVIFIVIYNNNNNNNNNK